MTSLLDIGDLTEEVEVRGVKIQVQGLSAGHIFQLFSKFPEVRNMIGNKTGSPQEIMLALAPALIAKIIAMATGNPDDKEVEAKAAQLGAGDQLKIIAAVQRISFKDGLGPFIEEVNGLLTSASAGLPTHSETFSNSATNSAAPSNALLQMDTPNLMRGHARRVN